MNFKKVRTCDIEMAYYSFGRGERAFVILPGLDTKSVLTAAKAVEGAYSMFAEDYTVYLFDRRSNMPAPYSIREMADDTAAVMRQIGIADADIFGASQGGMIALCMAIDHPDTVHALALGSTATHTDDVAEAGIEEWIRLAKARDMTALTADFIDNLYSADTIGKYRDILIHMNDRVSDRDIDRFIIQAESIIGFSVLDELQKITCPVLVIGCEGDKLIPPASSREIADRLGCALYMYGTEYGHCVFDEAPDYKDRLLRFFHQYR